MNCSFCYNVWRKDSSQIPRDLPLDSIETILQNLSNTPGVEGVTLTGGEPLLRKDISHIVAICRREGLKAAIASNGALLSRSKINELIESGIQHFDIGFTEPSHDTRIAMTEAARSGCTVTASICLHNSNYRRIGALTEMAAALGADAIALNKFIPTGMGARNSSYLEIGIEDLLYALEMANQTALRSGVYIYTGIPVEPCIASSREFPEIVFSTCQCGHSKWAIDPRGNLRTCEQNGKKLGNLLEYSFRELLERNSTEISKFRKWKPSENCILCDWRKDCHGGCRFK